MPTYSTRVAQLLLALPVFLSVMAAQYAHGDEPDTLSIEVEFSDKADTRTEPIKFEEQSEEVPFVLYAADPELLKQKYVATIVFTREEVEGGHYARSAYGRGGSIKPMDRLVMGFWTPLRSHQDRSLGGGGAQAIEVNSLVELMLKHAPEEKKPSQEMQKRLLNKELYRAETRHDNVVVGKGRFSSRAPSAGGKVTVVDKIQILGSDVESVKAAAAALIALYDAGLTTPIQQGMIDEMKRTNADLPDALARYEKYVAESKKLGEQLSKLERISEQSITDLTTQRRLITVEISGAQARLDACDKILRRLPNRSKAAEQVEAIKITAEIELVGLTARKEAISNIIDKGNLRRDLASQQTVNLSTASKVRKQLERDVRTIGYMELSRRNYRPMNVQGNLITINPVKWTSAPPGSRSGFGIPGR